MSEQLFPCPFCGSAAEWSKGLNKDGSDWDYISCEKCEAIGPIQSCQREGVIFDWNTRQPAQSAECGTVEIWDNVLFPIEHRLEMAAGSAAFWRECHANQLEQKDYLKAENDQLRTDLETERMRLAACGIVALANTSESAIEARRMLPRYESESCKDVARMVDEQIKLRALVEQQKGVIEGLTSQCGMRQAIEQAHMAGQINAGVDPSYSEAQNYAAIASTKAGEATK